MVARFRLAALFAMTATVLAPLPSGAQGILEQMQDDIANIVSRARPSIVSIEDERVFGGQRGRPNEQDRTKPDGGKGDRGHAGPPFQRRPIGEPPKVGSGFSIGDGFIVTTADVLSGMKNPMVMTEDGRRFHATVSGIDPEMNIGVLKLVSKTALPGLKLGQSNLVYPGHFAISIGNQFGHVNSVALTLVAGIRDDGVPADGHFYPGLIQISGTVGVGTSGAPILNVRGEVVGMMAGIPFGDWTSSPFLNMPGVTQPGTAPGGAGAGRMRGIVEVGVPPGQSKPDTALGSSGSGEQSSRLDPRVVFMRPPVTSAGFAVPIDDMKPVLTSLRQSRLVHCWLGVDMKEERSREESDGIVTSRRAVRVSTVYPNSPAAAAGMQVGDVLSTVNGRPISRLWNIRAALLRAQPGDKMEVRIERKGVRQMVNARLTARPEIPAAPTPSQPGKH